MTIFPAKLLQGYYNFMAGSFQAEKSRHELLAKEGQKPHSMVISCCDSRATPEKIFDTSPGEIFVLRNIANLVPPFSKSAIPYGAAASAIEYGILELQVKNVLILGHAHCGGIQKILAGQQKPLSSSDFTGRWMRLIDHLAHDLIANNKLSERQKQIILEQRSIQASLSNLRSFPFIKEREEQGKLALFGAWFGIANGELWILNEKTGEFCEINNKTNQAI